MKYWIAVISLEHALIAYNSEFIQVCHGKEGPLRKTSAGDIVYIYCPKTEMKSGESVKRIEFRGQFKNDSVYQYEQRPGFSPYRKDVTYEKLYRPVFVKDAEGLEWTQDRNWGMLARSGFFEISPHDGELLMSLGELVS